MMMTNNAKPINIQLTPMELAALYNLLQSQEYEEDLSPYQSDHYQELTRTFEYQTLSQGHDIKKLAEKEQIMSTTPSGCNCLYHRLKSADKVS